MPTVDEFGAGLKELTVRAGFSLRELARTVNMPRSTVADALSGRRLPRQETVLAIVRACAGDVDAWRDTWTRVELARRPNQAAAPVVPAVTEPPHAESPLAEPAPPATDEPRRRRRRLIAAAVGLCAVSMAVGGFVVSHASSRGAGGASCRPARRYEVVQSGNLLSGDRTIIVITQPGDVFFATQLDATPYTSRHYGVLERTRQWGYVDSAKLAKPAPACLPDAIPAP